MYSLYCRSDNFKTVDAALSGKTCICLSARQWFTTASNSINVVLLNYKCGNRKITRLFREIGRIAQRSTLTCLCFVAARSNLCHYHASSGDCSFYHCLDVKLSCLRHTFEHRLAHRFCHRMHTHFDEFTAEVG